MKLVPHKFIFISMCCLLATTASAHAGQLCDWLGVGCDPVAAAGRSSDDDGPAPTIINQNSPPEVFSLTISGNFTKWTDIEAQNFVCDTRKREDRACKWQGYIPEIKRNAVLSFKPFSHDQGMYKVRGFIEHNMGRDTSYAGSIVAPDGGYILNEMSIINLSQNPFIVEYYASDYKGVINFEKKYGHLTFAFKEVLK